MRLSHHVSALLWALASLLASASSADSLAQRKLATAPAGETFRDCDGCPEMVMIPAGSFTMGSPATEPGHDSEEGPQHQVNIARAFAVGKYEVTFEEWDACVREKGCSYSPSDNGQGRGKRPVTNVSHRDAKVYTGWLSRKSGRNYRLLTEAEWEYVARAGTNTAFSSDAGITPQQANYATTFSYAGSPVATSPRNAVPVGSYARNAFGVYDVHGNVWEWTEDCWHASYDGAPSDGSAWTSGECSQRVTRGGSWDSVPQSLRSAFRGKSTALFRISEYGGGTVGFRVSTAD